MSRPAEYQDRVTTSLRLTPDLYERLHAVAKEREVSVNVLVVSLVSQGLDRLLPLEDLLRTES